MKRYDLKIDVASAVGEEKAAAAAVALNRFANEVTGAALETLQRLAVALGATEANDNGVSLATLEPSLRPAGVTFRDFICLHGKPAYCVEVVTVTADTGISFKVWSYPAKLLGGDLSAPPPPGDWAKTWSEKAAAILLEEIQKG